jgi:hypothetical protein
VNGLKKLKSKKAEEVVIFIGLIQWREKERKLVALLEVKEWLSEY